MTDVSIILEDTIVSSATVAVFIGVRIIKIISEKVFFKIVTWALLLISLKLIYDGLQF